MFRKNSPKIETILGHGTQIKWELAVQGTLRVDGVLEGDVRADCVIVGESGRIKGNVRSRAMVVGGGVEGNITADEVVELQRNARVFGEIRAGKLSVSEGAIFDGQSRMKPEPEADAGAEGRVISLKPPATSS